MLFAFIYLPWLQIRSATVTPRSLLTKNS
uniref:Uncharacterized protein n=1 Tax=Anguilla anguilla TaxID=7936 RepID=A0A0E9V402_ANGAN